MSQIVSLTGEVGILEKLSFWGWKELSDFEKIRDIYNFVRDEILFGYNVDDGIPCRVHGFTIKKELQEGAMMGL